MNRKRCLRWALIAFAFLAVVATVGWISNANSKALCQQQVGSWLANQPIGGRFFYLLDPDKDEEATFKSLAAKYEVASKSDGRHTWPRLSMKTHSLIPFLISIDYFWEREFLLGGGATKWYLCFFGKVFEIGETNEFAT